MKDIPRFIAGFEQFRTKYFIDQPELFTDLARGQQPSALVISCCDSRVDPVMLTGAVPGELFVVRNVANLVPPYLLHADEAPGVRSAVEFAVKALEVPHIIVLGHSGCGGIRALMEGEGIVRHAFEFIGPWVEIARPAREKVLCDLPHAPLAVQARACEQEAILVSLGNLMSFPWIRERTEAGTLELHGWYFDLETGDLLVHEDTTGKFEKALAPQLG